MCIFSLKVQVTTIVTLHIYQNEGESVAIMSNSSHLQYTSALLPDLTRTYSIAVHCVGSALLDRTFLVSIQFFQKPNTEFIHENGEGIYALTCRGYITDTGFITGYMCISDSVRTVMKHEWISCNVVLSKPPFKQCGLWDIFEGYRTLLETQSTLHHDSKYPLYPSSNDQCTSIWFYC